MGRADRDVGRLQRLSGMVTRTMADEWNKETKLEFSAPVEVPGKVLTAGKYVFKIADSESNRNIRSSYSCCCIQASTQAMLRNVKTPLGPEAQK
jgi:hypothetical protein